MNWTLRNIYLYVVCLITLVMVIAATVGFVRGIVELVYPDPGYYAGPFEGQSEKDYQAEKRSQEEQSRRQAVLNLVSSGAMLLVAGPLYVYHWRKIESERPVRGEGQPGGV